tara:strand:- start:4570 stop:5412 length:843 start_codon:yes stop_codon:yes gene_type:complete
MGFLRKKFKQIKNGVKKVLQKAGKFFNDIGPLGSIGLMLAAPYAANAMFGTSFKTIGSAFGKEAGTEVAKEAIQEEIKGEVTDKVTRETINSAAGNAAKTLLDESVNIASDSLSDAISMSLDESFKGEVTKEAAKSVASSLDISTVGGPIKNWFGDVGSALKNHYTDLVTPESLSEGALDLTTGYVESQVMSKAGEALGLIETPEAPPRAGQVMGLPSEERAQSAYMEDIAPLVANSMIQPMGGSYNEFANGNIYSNNSPNFIKAFSAPMMTEILPLPRV